MICYELDANDLPQMISGRSARGVSKMRRLKQNSLIEVSVSTIFVKSASIFSRFLWPWTSLILSLSGMLTIEYFGMVIDSLGRILKLIFVSLSYSLGISWIWSAAILHVCLFSSPLSLHETLPSLQHDIIIAKLVFCSITTPNFDPNTHLLLTIIPPHSDLLLLIPNN